MVRVTFITALVVALSAAPAARAQLNTLLVNTGKSYGLTAWGAAGWQKAVDNSFGYYGVNIKYGAQHWGAPYVERDPLAEKVTYNAATCEVKKETYCQVDTVGYPYRLSFGVGYLNYFGLSSSLPHLDADMDLGGPYAGVWLNWMPAHSFISITAGYVAGIVSAETVLGDYVGPAVAGQGAGQGSSPVSFKVGTSVSHAFEVGLSARASRDLTFFAEYSNTFAFTVKDVLFTPLDGASKSEIQSNLRGDINLTSSAIKAGASFTF